MGQQIIKNPETGNFQIFSSITDAFVLKREATLEELKEYWKEEYGRNGMRGLESVLERISESDKPYYQFTKTWEEACMWDAHQTKHIKVDDPDCQICKDRKDG